MSFHLLLCNFCVVESTLCYWSMVFACRQTLLSLIPFKLIWFHEFFSHGVATTIMTQMKNGLFITINFRWTWFFFYILLHPSKCKGFFNVYTNRQIGFFIHVPTWHGERKAWEVFFYQFYAHFIGKDC